MMQKGIWAVLVALMTVAALAAPLVGSHVAVGAGEGLVPEVAISVDANALDLGELRPGNVSGPQDLAISNIGGRNVTVTFEVTNENSPLMVPGLTVDGGPWSDYSVSIIAGGNDNAQMYLEVPDDYSSPIGGAITVWAEERAPGPSSVMVLNSTVDLNAGTNDTLVVGQNSYQVDQATDIGALMASGLGFTVDDAYRATYGSFTLNSIAGIDSDWVNGPTWFILINGQPAVTGLGTNNLSDGDQISFVHCPWDPATFDPLVDQADHEIALKVAVVPTGAAHWPRFQHDLFNSGVTTEAGPRSNNGSYKFATFTSTQATVGGIDVAPVCYGDLIYVGSVGGMVSAMNRSTGAVVWQNNVSGGFSLGTPAVGMGMVFMGTNDGRLAALDANTGDVRWTAGDGELGQINTPIVYDQGRVYFGTFGASSRSDAYYCYNITGAQVWSFPGEGFYWAGAAVVRDHIIFGGDDGRLCSLDKVTGTAVDQVSADEVFGFDVMSIRSSLCYEPADERVYFTSLSGHCLYIGLDGNGVFRTMDNGSASIGLSTSTPAVFNGRVYVGMSEPFNGIACLDTATLETIWTYDAGDIVQSSPALSSYYDDGDGDVYIYFTTNAQDGALTCLKDVTGGTTPTVQFTFVPEPAEFALQGVVVSDGMVYFGNDAGYLFGLGEG
jgi:outer membrane protein assembly factor BamB